MPPNSGELYFLRILLTKVKRPTSYEDILTINGTFHKTFRETCYSLGLLDNDEEFVEAIKEVSLWASRDYLRRLFTNMLFSNTISQLEYVWHHS